MQPSLLSRVHISALSKAFAQLLGSPNAGTMAFVRCFTPEMIAELCVSHDGLDLPGWDVYGVVGAGRSGDRLITADRAVDLREEKRGSTLLLVDAREAGAGMDGIYSAVREIGEQELLRAATDVTKKQLIPAARKFAEKAVARARRVGRVSHVSPWREFDFYAYCRLALDEADSLHTEEGRRGGTLPEAPLGACVALLGLWPVHLGSSDASLSPETSLDRSMQLVERLLLPAGAGTTIQTRLDGLLMPAGAEDQKAALERFLRATENERWTERVLRLSAMEDLHVGRLTVGFDRPDLRSIKILPWTGATGNLLRWTGLTQSGGDFLFTVDSADRSASKLEVRWTTEPAELPAGAVQYEVAILTGGDTPLAVRTVAQTASAYYQKCAFTGDDLDEELDEAGKWEAIIRVTPLVNNPNYATGDVETIPFVLTFGDGGQGAPVGVGKKVRALVEEAVKLEEADFVSASRGPAIEDARRFISYSIGSGRRGARVYRPPLLKEIEEDWRRRDYAPGRWVVRVRTDGSPAGPIQFAATDCPPGTPADLWNKWVDAGRTLGTHVQQRCGFVGMIHHSNDLADRYVNTAAAVLDSALEQGETDPALVHTLEVRSLSGRNLGLIVLPSHPLRVAWHQGYDELAFHARYREILRPSEVIESLAPLNGGYMPLFLPGLEPGESFVFGDMLGFFAVAMTRQDEGEPQAVIAQMARCLSAERDEVAPSVGATTADAIGREIDRYLNLHPAYSSVRVAALRPGDGLTVARALGRALQLPAANDARAEGNEDRLGERAELRSAGFLLDLFPSPGTKDHQVVGRFLSETTERRRAGAGAVGDADRWILETYRYGTASLPRLRWAKRSGNEPAEPNHLAVAFDTFQAEVVALAPDEIARACGTTPSQPATRPMEVFGLAPALVRHFEHRPVPTWTTTAPQHTDGEKHPAGRQFTDRLNRVHAALLRLTARNLDDLPDMWPALRTVVSAEKADALRRLHESSDWVITVDRTAGIEYFDAPHDDPSVYDTYVIDCVPERQDLSNVQLVTSTVCVEEVTALLDATLADMGLSRSPRNSRQVLSELKAVSGRLAMRLANRAQSRGELIALALFHAACAAEGNDGEPGLGSGEMYPSLADGFLVPLDDVRDLLLPLKAARGAREPGPVSDEVPGSEGPLPWGDLRADLVYVSLPSKHKSNLRFQFVEVKYRRLLKSAVDPALADHIARQTSATRERLRTLYFSPELTQTQRAIRRKLLARALQFYADKARRHRLADEKYARLSAAIDRLFRADADWTERDTDLGYVFCPEVTGAAREVGVNGGTRIVLFGPVARSSGSAKGRSVQDSAVGGAASIDTSPDAIVAPRQSKTPDGAHRNTEVSLRLGQSVAGQFPIEWRVSTRGNPHLMVVGQPGMGKTHCITNLCKQYVEQGVTPIVFAFHHDLEERLGNSLPKVRMVDIANGLGFNPLKVTREGQHAWIDNIGLLRDVFAAIFPDFGDLQNNEIREAIKQSYLEQGFGASAHESSKPETPRLQRFYDLLRSKPKPNPGILHRLGELDDYGFFAAENSPDDKDLLASSVPAVVRLYATQNEAVQNAMAAFVLLSLYQQMFARGVQSNLTHVIIFDEAHRASRLKLIPIMAKECRKYGISFIVASQEVRDFSPSLFSAISNYLILRVTDTDAAVLAKNSGASGQDAVRLSGRLKTLPKFHALFATESEPPVVVQLTS